jgi:glycosyltransferase involved in cell wall biosynthesis
VSPLAHIAVVSTSYPRSRADAAGHFVQSEVHALAAHGHQVTVLTPAGSDETAPERVLVLALGGGRAFGWPGAVPKLRANPALAVQALSFSVSARRALARLAPDAIVAHWLVPGLFPIAHGATCPITAVAHGSDVALLCRLPGPLVSLWLRRLLREQVRLRFVSHRLRRDLKARCDQRTWALLERHSYVEPCAIDTSGVPNRRDARARLGLDDRFLALCVSRLIAGKRIDWALARAPVGAGTRWVVIGDGPERGRLERSHPDVTFLGALDRAKTLTWLSAADVLVFCSEREGAPTIIREARNLGTRVWSNDVGDVREWALRDAGIQVICGLTPPPVF